MSSVQPASTLVLVRHGQASLGSDDYDRLSELGKAQSELLGRYWAEAGLIFDSVRVGPLRRHAETHAGIVEGYRSGELELPSAETLEAMCEHQAIAMLRRAVGDLGPKGPPGDRAAMKAWFNVFDNAMRQWIKREVCFDDLESWQAARRRVDGALERLKSDLKPGTRTLAVTSGGFVSMAVGAIQGLEDIEVYELSLNLRNSAWAEIRFDGSVAELVAFNSHPHLAQPELHTVV